MTPNPHRGSDFADFLTEDGLTPTMTPTMTPTNNLPAQLREFNRWRRGDETMDQPHPKDIGEMLDAAADRLEELERELAEVKADADEWRNMAHSRKLQADKANRELAAERKLADRLASALADSAMWHAPPAYQAWKEARRDS